MSISHSNRTYYTKEEYEAAKRNDNALFYAQRQGYDLVRTGRYFYMRQHDSLVFAPSGAWFWNSRGLSGRALEFIVFYEGRSFPEAVLILAGTVQPGFTPRVIPRSIPPPVKQPQPIPFVLPKPADNNRQLFAYLCGRRKLEEAIVREMLEQKVLYESVSPNQICGADLFESIYETLAINLFSSGGAYSGVYSAVRSLYNSIMPIGVMMMFIYFMPAFLCVPTSWRSGAH